MKFVVEHQIIIPTPVLSSLDIVVVNDTSENGVTVPLLPFEYGGTREGCVDLLE